METLIDYIGVLGGHPDNQAPESGLYINQLPGITLKSIDSIANDEQITWKKVWSDVQERAYRKFRSALLRQLAKKYKISTLKSSHCLEFEESEAEEGQSEHYKGFTIKTSGIPRNRTSSFLTVHISKLGVYVASDAEITIKVFDVESGSELYSVNKSLPKGWNEIKVNKNFHSDHIFIAYNASSIDSKVTNLLSDGKPVGDCYIYSCANCNVLVQGAISEDIESPTNITTGINTYGLKACFSIHCTFDSLVDRNKFLFVNPWLFALGAELMIERQYSERLNRFTTAGKQQAQELTDHFNVEFESAIKDTVAGLNLDANDCCFNCETGGIEQTKSLM